MSDLLDLLESAPIAARGLITTRIAHSLTLAARDVLAGDRSESAKLARLACLMELEHDLVQQSAKYLRADPRRYSEDDFVRIIEERAASGDCQRYLNAATRDVLDHPGGG